MKKKNTLANAQVKENLNSGTEWKKSGAARADLQINDMLLQALRFAFALLCSAFLKRIISLLSFFVSKESKITNAFL